MYAKFGMLEKAQEIFNILPFQTVVSWTALISGYAQHGHGERALSSFDSMRSEGLSPNAITLACVLKACGVVGNLHKGEELHQEINEKCLLRNDNVLGTALVDMYAKCGALAMAQEVFDELSFRDIISWNALISGYCQKGQIDEALRVLEQMKCEGFLPDAATFNCILRTCASVGATGKAKRIHEEIVERDFLGRHHTVLSTALISMYAKGGAFEMAEKVFDDLIIYDVRSTNVLIAGYCQHDCLNEALEHYEQMIRKGFSPDTGTFACLLRACGRTGASENGEELHCEVMRLGISNEHNIIGSALVDMYVRFGHLVKAQGVLDKLAVQDLASWTSLIHGYCQCGQNHEALSGFHKMKEQGLSPDEVTFACILKACGSSCAINKGISIHAEIEREGLMEKFEMLGSALVDMYAKCGATAKAQEVFDKLLNRDLITWTALIDGYCQRGLGEEALYCFDQMRREISSLDAVTFACILKVCGSIGAVERGAILHDEILQNGLLGKDNVLDIALLDMYAKCGALFKAQEVFNDLPVHTVVTWNVLMAGYCQHGNGEEVLKCFDAMKHEGISPDAVTFVTVLKACRRIRALDKSFMYFEMMKKDYDIIPNLEHYSCMIEILGHEGKFEKALNFVRNMPSHEQLEGWSALLSACRKQGNVILGRLAFEHMVQLDQDV
ncbi:hypothetical protein KP509_37G053600 [Ceratopteris richardii]|nr:hypothetical protein KP509_37G053600 [Ceratopteris richardii]